MALDSSIPLRGQGIQVPDFLGMLGQAEQIRNSRVQRQSTLAGLARQESNAASDAEDARIQRQRVTEKHKADQFAKKVELAKEATKSALPWMRAIPDPVLRAKILRGRLQQLEVDDPEIGDSIDDATMDRLEASFGKQSGTPAKPDTFKGQNGNMWTLDANGVARDTGAPFHQEPKQQPQGSLLQIPGQIPMTIRDGVATPVVGAPVLPEKADPKINDSQSAAALYGKRIQQAMLDMEALEKAGFDRASPTSGIRARLPNVIQSESGQRQEQAERNFINAVLRRESGAVISPEEFASAAKQYFPRSGDADATKEQKKRNREQAFEGLKSASGGAWKGVKLVTESTGNNDPATVGLPRSSTITRPDEEAEYQAWKKAQGQ